VIDKLDLTSELLALLDLIEIETEDEHIRSRTRQRHDIARKAGYTVVFGERISGEMN